MFLHENALNPFRYQTLLKMETEVVVDGDRHGRRLGRFDVVGRDRVDLPRRSDRPRPRRRPGRHWPRRCVCADTAHPAFAKACHYLGVDQILTPADRRRAGRPRARRRRDHRRHRPGRGVGPLLPLRRDRSGDRHRVAAPQSGTSCATSTPVSGASSCRGGSDLGHPVPPWDFRVEGVTSMSADIHKYGYTLQGRLDDHVPRSRSVPQTDLHVRLLARRPVRLVVRSRDAFGRPDSGGVDRDEPSGRGGLPAARERGCPTRPRRSRRASPVSTDCRSRPTPTCRSSNSGPRPTTCRRSAT